MVLNKSALKWLLVLLPVISIAQVKSSGLPSNAVKQDDAIIRLQWQGIQEVTYTETDSKKYLMFEGAAVADAAEPVPTYQVKKALKSAPSSLEVTLIDPVYETLSREETVLVDPYIKESTPRITHTISWLRKRPVAIVDVVPLRRNAETGAIERLVSFTLDVLPLGRGTSSSTPRTFASTSVLSTGTWHRIGVADDAVYKLTPAWFESQGIDVASINPQNIRIFGNGGGMLPFENNVPRHDDLLENAIYVEGEADGQFNAEDFVLFYGQSPHRWQEVGTEVQHAAHWYSDTTYYFITLDQGAGKRLQPQANSTASADVVVTSFNDYQFHEKDWTNLIKTGRHWYGEHFNSVTEYDFGFNFPDIDLSAPALVRARVAGRCPTGQSSYSISVDGSSASSENFTAANSCYTCTYAYTRDVETTFNPTGSTPSVTVALDQATTTSQAWLDYLEISVRRKLNMSTDMMPFRDRASLGQGVAEYQFTYGEDPIRVWDVTDPSNALEQEIDHDAKAFRVDTDTLHEFVAFTGNVHPEPSYHGTIGNQNLHAWDDIDMVIVTHPRFKAQAEELAEFHRSGATVPAAEHITVGVATTTQVYNEFSSGAQDITAIKDLMRMLYVNAGSDTTKFPRYLLLFGDGSYDMKDRITGNTNMVPTYQSHNSWKPTDSYTSDDYFGILDENESDKTTDVVDLGIGRLPVKSVSEAQAAVAKIKHYYDTRSFGAWRNWVAFIGDDEDSNIHMRDANRLALRVDTANPEFNIDKIFFDAYPQTSTSGGERYPAVADAIDIRMDKGALIVSYVGHGGELGWAHERVLEISQINRWDNYDRLPLFVTATCEFSRYDDPQRTSAGELVFLNPSGGGIGLLTTTRLVFSTPNFQLANQFFNNAFKPLDEAGTMPTLGDLGLITKINGPLTLNSRNFTLLGDPALTLAYPKYGVVTTAVPDTIKALSKVTVTGYVVDAEGVKLDQFNGTIYPTVFDKATAVETLSNDGFAAYSFSLRKNILFKGKASVTNGDFTFTFVVPRDINYSFGAGKISYYFDNGSSDGNGYTEEFSIGGSEANSGTDDEGPEAELYMNDEQFVFGGITDEQPDLLAHVFDENGINTVGSGIGHDIVAVLDANTSKAIVLNDFYEAELDSYQRGSIRYPFSELEDGPHTLSLKVWDVYNNSTDAYTEFVVAQDAELALSHVLNYPNPFTTNTGFYFEHNRPGQSLDVKIQIFTVSGKLVRTLDSYVSTDGFRVGPIQWNGLDDYSDKIGKGVYIYKLRVLAPDGKSADEFEKLVILN